MPTAAAIRRYASNPLTFLADLAIPAARGTAKFSTVMAPHQRQRFEAIAPALIAVANGQCPEIGRHWWEATKGASKDSDLAACLLWLLSFTRRPLTCQIGAADSDQADELRKAAKSILRLNSWLDSRVRVQNSRLLCESTNSEAQIIAADTAGSHGARPDVLILNELSHVTKWEFAENLLDNASKVPHGLVVVATNAGFVGTPAHKWREMARTSPRWSFQQFAQPAPWLDAAEIEEARRRNTLARFLRLWQGVWSSGGDALEDADIEAAIDHALGPIVSRVSGVGFVGGLDLGIKSDHSGFVVIGKQQLPGQQPAYRLASCETWAPGVGGKVDLSAIEDTILAAHRAFNLQAVAFDPWQAMLLAERLTKAGIRMIEVPFSGKSLDLLARNLLEVFRNRVFTMFDCPRLITDLRKLSIVEKSYGYRLEATRDASGHADAATALVLALLAARDHCHSCGSAWGGTALNTSNRSLQAAWQFGTYRAGHRSTPGIHWDRAT